MERSLGGEFQMGQVFFVRRLGCEFSKDRKKIAERGNLVVALLHKHICNITANQHRAFHHSKCGAVDERVQPNDWKGSGA